MTSLDIDEATLQIRSAFVTDTELIILLKDGRRVAMPLWWSPALFNATIEERNNWAIMPFGDALEWDDIEEYISVKGILIGNPAPNAVPPAYVTAPVAGQVEGSVG